MTITAAATPTIEAHDVTPTVSTVTINNVCQCMHCDACGITFGEDPTGPAKCPECETGEDVTFGDCGGSCYHDALADLSEAVREWAENNPSIDNEWVLTGEGMGWRHLSGTQHIDLTTSCLSNAIGVNSEWTQNWTVETDPGGRLTATQSHHDAMGEVYTVTPLR